MLINKADLLSEQFRQNWAEYFEENGVEYIYFSAFVEKASEDLKALIDQNEILPDEEGSKKLKEVSSLVEKIQSENKNSNEKTKILNRNELLEKLEIYSKEIENGKTFFTVGFVGYPNVGKSSVINVLMRSKKVGVAAMPGKTKHYQTLFLPDNKGLCLMDCPGLVFPSFKKNKAEMLCNGILPIDTLREYLSSISIITQQIPRLNLNTFYKIDLPELYSAAQFLEVLATKRGLLIY